MTEPVYMALLKFQRREFEACIQICSKIIEQNPLDQAVWFLKVRALTAMDYIDDTDMEEEGIAEIIMDENSIAKAPRPGTSLMNPLPSNGTSMSMRPMTGQNRPVTGFVRPSTSSKGSGANLEAAFKGNRPGTSRAVSSAGRFVRLGTQSMLSLSGKFIDADQIDIPKYVKRPALAKALCDYLFYVEHNPKKALELCAEATASVNFKDWWWKARLGKAYYQLGMLRESQQQFRSAIKQQDMIQCSLELAKIFIRLDQPNSALDTYLQAAETYPGDSSLVIGCARVCEALNDTERAIDFYKKVLRLDTSNVESIASLASYNFYTDQPEIALRFYRRLLQMGVSNTELWNNIGLCCFYSSQYDMALSSFERALSLADDSNMADVWYNMGHVGIGIGDLTLANQCFSIAVSVDSNHAESFNNLGVLELRRGNPEKARSLFETAVELSPHIFEPQFNGCLLASAMGDCQKSYDLCKASLEAFPDHKDSKQQLIDMEKAFLLQ